jgi:hypothetical protein
MPLIRVTVKCRRKVLPAYPFVTIAYHSPSISRICGVFSFTYAAEFPLHTTGSPQRTTPAELIYEPCQFQQIRHPEDRTMLA